MPTENQNAREYLRNLLSSLSHKPKILIIDDEYNDRYLISEFLKKYSCEIIECSNPELAIQIISDESFDIIFLDVKMPPGDGVEILKKIRELNPTQTVIVMTGYDEASTREKVLDLGPQLIWRKPVKEKDIDDIFNILNPHA